MTFVTRPKLLILCRYSFGYQTDAYQWCKYLRDEFDIHYVCLEDRFSRPVQSLRGIKVSHISARKNTCLRGLNYILGSSRELRGDYDLCLLQYFPGCALLKIVRPSSIINLDFRSGGISDFFLSRWVSDCFLRFERLFFQHTTVLSKSLARRIRLKNAHIVPLGAEIISQNKKRSFSGMHMLYVGTLQNRKIEKTVQGFARFCHDYCNDVDLSYTIIGSGPDNEEAHLRELADKEGLSETVNVVGYVHHSEIKKYFDYCNFGVSFIPMTTYYDVQPPTKTYEYLLSGMPVIATATSENRRVVNESNGVLINDEADEFASGLEELYRLRQGFNSEKIRKSMMAYTWENIVNTCLKPYLTGLLQKHLNAIDCSG